MPIADKKRHALLEMRKKRRVDDADVVDTAKVNRDIETDVACLTYVRISCILYALTMQGLYIEMRCQYHRI